MSTYFKGCGCAGQLEDHPCVVGGHSFVLGEDEVKGAPACRWECSCRRRGQWQWQSDSVAYHSWRAHIVRADRRSEVTR